MARFDALRDLLAPRQQLTHIVRPDWLQTARDNPQDHALTAELIEAIAAAEGRVLCTCSTLGPLAATLGALRIDAPMMARAAQIGGRICLAYCLHSTAQPSQALLQSAGVETIDMLHLPNAWPAFEDGDQSRFASVIAEGICRHLNHARDTNVVLLAQASMDVALPLLRDAGVPVLASPELAMRALIDG
ncbi:hypothetical protein [Actibacterium mucosum]|uniref:hypothetical protein n=1 Tax=Actibacterium mucosum TaxID=1087332 RepID=UPI000A68F911|nr:hypothetical protein [Actibacterium mucosum]